LYWHLGQKSSKYQIRTEHRNNLPAQAQDQRPPHPEAIVKPVLMRVSPRGDRPKIKFLKEASPDYNSYSSTVHPFVGLGLPLLIHEVKRQMWEPRLRWRKMSTTEFT